MVATAHAARQTLALPPIATQPYLATMSSPGLRFGEAPPTVPLARKPIASGPPVAAAAPEVAEVTLANNQAAASTPPMPLPGSEPAAPAKEPAKADPAPTPKVKPIIPDDTPKPVQSQDFLPLFRFPGSGNSEPDVIVMPNVPAPPTPGTLPASSATYRVQ